MARKKKHEGEHENSERWLLTYSDLITLLMIFFVVMYAMSNVDAKKYEQLSQSLGTSLNPTAYQNEATNASSSAVKADPNETKPADIKDPELQKAYEEIKKLVKEKGLESKVSVGIHERGVVVGLMNTVLFEPGSAAIKEDAQQTLIEIGRIANDVHNYIRVEGNTDDVPMNTPQFPSNWELSVVRATEVVKLLISQSGVSPDKISAVGYGEYRPTVPNTSAENRSRNRKVDIVILSDSLDKSESSLNEGSQSSETQKSETKKED